MSHINFSWANSRLATSLCYLALPYFLFFAGWFSPGWAWGFSILLLLALLLAFTDLRTPAAVMVAGAHPQHATHRWGVALFLLLAVGAVALSGIGGYGYQDVDWGKHNILLKDLVEQPWPVTYTFYGRTAALVYYVAYYLPAAAVGKVWGLAAAHQLLALWSWLGLLLTGWWVTHLSGRAAPWAMLLFLAFSGLEVAGVGVYHLGLPWLPAASTWDIGSNLDSWADGWQYSANLMLLFATPHQALGGWLATALLLDALWHHSSRRSLLLLAALTTLWSPFITLGLLPFFLSEGWSMLSTAPRWRQLWRALSIQNGVGLLLLGILGLFYATKLVPLIPPLDLPFRGGFFFAEVPSGQRLRWLALLAIFLCLEVGILVWLARRTMTAASVQRRTFWSATGWLLLLPFYVWGQHNDLVMRASIPALFVLAIGVARSWDDWRQRGWPARLGWLVLITLCAINPLVETVKHVTAIAQRGALYELHFNERQSLATRYAVDFNLIRQYLSATDTPFFQLFAPQAIRQQPQPEPAWLFDQKIILVGHTLSARQVQPGGSVDLLLELRAIAPMTVNYTLAVRLIGAGDTVIWSQQGWPVGMPTSTWEPGRGTLYDQRQIQIPPATRSGLYRLELYFADPTTGSKLAAVQLPMGAVWGDIAPFSYLVVGKQPMTPALLASPIHFGERFALTGAQIDCGTATTELTSAPITVTVNAGIPFTVTLVWRTLQPPQEDFTAFVHLVDGAGQLVAQQDHPLADGVLPTRLWLPGLAVADHYQLTLPPDTPPGAYTLWLGLYTWPSGTRLPLTAGGEGDASRLDITILSH
ncbi:MAG: hypothetical protein R3C14_09500 [Caldilineaceae bacterium]